MSGWLIPCPSSTRVFIQRRRRASLAPKVFEVGTYVTNPVTRHWSVQAANARGLENLAPGTLLYGDSDRRRGLSIRLA